MPGLFCFDSTPLEFVLDTQGEITLAPAAAKTLDMDTIDVVVTFQDTHSNDVMRNELGPICRINFSWNNDGSPEAYCIGLFKQGGGYRQDVSGMALVWAYVISNDGEAGLGTDPNAKLIRFEPGKTDQGAPSGTA